MADENMSKVLNAYRMVLKKDAYLLKVEANERSITHKMAEYLQMEFSEYNVDCEYNRNGLDKKALLCIDRPTNANDTEGTTVFPDIIVHHRGTNNNLVVIEAKKSSNTDKSDRDKLKMYKTNLGYQYAYFVIFPVGKKLEDFKEARIDDYVSPI